MIVRNVFLKKSEQKSAFWLVPNMRKHKIKVLQNIIYYARTQEGDVTDVYDAMVPTFWKKVEKENAPLF